MLEPTIEWDSLQVGRPFAHASCVLDDRLVNTYLAATGESDPLYAASARAGFTPFLLTTMVRYSKASILGRWPSGTVQLSQRVRCRRALQRGEALNIACELVRKEARGGRGYFELLSTVFDANGHPVGEHAGLSLWGEQVPPDAATAPPPVTAEKKAAVQLAAGERIEGRTDREVLSLSASFGMPQLKAFGEVAAARDPIHLDPAFARTTRYGRNIAQGRLVMALFSRLLLRRHGRRWLDEGWFDIRFSAPVFVDEPVQARAMVLGSPGIGPDAPRAYRLVCANSSGAIAIEGIGGVGDAY